MTDKPVHQMSDEELRQERQTWAEHVRTAAGWASAYFAAKQLEVACNVGVQRGLDGFDNPHPIVRG